MKEAFFSHDCDARYDSKILRLQRKHGWLGYGLFLAIIEKLRVESDYTLETDYENIAFEMQADAEIVKSIVCDFELFSFTEDGECFYSESFINRMNIKDNKRQKHAESAHEKWGSLDKNETNVVKRSQKLSEAQKKGTHTKE